MPHGGKREGAGAKPGVSTKKQPGNPVNENEPTPERGIPKMPASLCADAKKVWSHLAPILDNARMITLADGETFGALCEALARYHRAEKAIQKEGEIVPGDGTRDGKAYRNPWMVVLGDSLKIVMSLSIEFGMTPSSRSKIKVPPITEADDPLNLYLGGARLEPDADTTPPPEPEVEAS